MNPDAAALLQALLGHDGAVNTNRLADAVGMDPGAADDLLAALAVVGFVDPIGPLRWRVHPLLRKPVAHDRVVDLLRVLNGEPPFLRVVPEAPQPPPQPPPPPPPAPPRLLGLGPAARALGVSTDTLTDWARRGLVPFTWTAGGHRRFDVDAIRELLERRAA